MQKLPGLITAFLIIAMRFYGQQSETDRLMQSELKMTFPSIYFKHNSTDYASMPYTVDSCFKFIAANIKNLNSYPVWRDTLEKERLTYTRIQKIKTDLNKYVTSKQIHFQSMGTSQKISRKTIETSTNEKQRQYLLSLNSVLDLSGMISNKNTICKEKKTRKRIPRLVWCGWRYGFHWSGNGSSNKKKTNNK